jgi:hypothetical protein
MAGEVLSVRRGQPREEALVRTACISGSRQRIRSLQPEIGEERTCLRFENRIEIRKLLVLPPCALPRNSAQLEC